MFISETIYLRASFEVLVLQLSPRVVADLKAGRLLNV
jgi:hypothetical protein